VVSEDEEKRKMLNAVSEIKARRGTVIGISKKENEMFDTHVKMGDLGRLDGLVNTIPFQLLGYYMSVLQGFNPDKPRNLAKSVTVS